MSLNELRAVVNAAAAKYGGDTDVAVVASGRDSEIVVIQNVDARVEDNAALDDVGVRLVLSWA